MFSCSGFLVSKKKKPFRFCQHCPKSHRWCHCPKWHRWCHCSKWHCWCCCYCCHDQHLCWCLCCHGQHLLGFHTQRHPIAANLLISLYNCHTWWSGSMICDCGPPPCKFNVLWLSTANFQTIQICSHKHHTADCQIWLRHADKTSLILWQKIWILSWIGPPGGVVNSMPRTLYRPQGPWRYHVIGFVEDQEKVTNFKDQENMLLYYLLDVIVEISGYMKYKYMLCICCNCVCMLL